MAARYNWADTLASTEETRVEVPYPSPSFGKPSEHPWRERIAAASRFWEPRRIVYNLVLTAVVVVWVAATWPHFRGAMNLSSLLLLAILAALANVCYSAAYVVDVPLQRSRLATIWNRKRWVLWLLGMVFAIVLGKSSRVRQVFGL